MRKLAQIAIAVVVLLGSILAVATPAQARAPQQAECLDGEVVGTLVNKLDRTPIGLGESPSVIQLSWKGEGFPYEEGGFDRAVVVIDSMRNDYQVFALQVETAHMTRHCGTADQVKEYAAQPGTYTNAMVQTAQDANGNKPHSDEIGVFFVDVAQRQLVTLKDAPAGPSLETVMRHLQVVTPAGLVIGLVPVAETPVPGTTPVPDGTPALPPTGTPVPTATLAPSPAETAEPPTPVDTDGDKVVDSGDDCPRVPGDVTNKGCPLPVVPPELEPPTGPSWGERVLATLGKIFPWAITAFTVLAALVGGTTAIILIVLAFLAGAILIGTLAWRIFTGLTVRPGPARGFLEQIWDWIRGRRNGGQPAAPGAPPGPGWMPRGLGCLRTGCGCLVLLALLPVLLVLSPCLIPLIPVILVIWYVRRRRAAAAAAATPAVPPPPHAAAAAAGPP